MTDLSCFIKNIHDTHRIKAKSTVFTSDLSEIKLVKLDYLGAADYFITSIGVVYSRSKVYVNRKGFCTSSYLPMTVLDPYLPYKWVMLPTHIGKIWMPINQLMGWSFLPQTDESQRYFVAKHPAIYPLTLESCEWSDTPPDVPQDSVYLKFMQQIYGEN